MQFASINGVTLHYQLIGAPEGKPVLVFANSLGTDFRIWRDVILRLIGDFAIVTYDMRGHGLSDIGTPPYSMNHHVGDLAGLLDYLEVKNAIICGLSVGGMVAQGLYATRPDLVRALILCDTAHKIGTPDSWNARIAAVNKDGIQSIAEGIFNVWFTPAFHAQRREELAGYRNMLVRQPVDGYTGTCAALRDADFTEAARRIAAPTICIVGDQDGSTSPGLVLELAKLIPRSRYEVIKDAAHIPCVEQPEALTAVMRAFIDEFELGGKL
ncbi:3-oxoadipate enol-lactonase [Phyllobacterium zundukense]|uniref:3-oxoadipate enol-lactonase n=1 Tax=Phyllobacterium zundukense TaxID=1867719 RepID=A0A2N9VQ06_9HYPH|nr:3-oxoadipate enol-lactonase [Phyllobacterium zundukense]ATU94679.1 3-oxoadipate enol-lactonase [Phyllobacterium zundukense]PIO41574.1 3-oxoadipate enol-lactonase [Phyllobacterium zundukense]